jgi:hypothetical protein
VEGAGVLAHNDDTKGPEACLHLRRIRRSRRGMKRRDEGWDYIPTIERLKLR